MKPPYQYHARAFVYVISVGVFLIVGIAALLTARGYTIDVANRSIYKGGIILLSSTPNNAYITIDNRVRKQRTTARIKVRPGTYHVKVDKPGTQAWEKDLRVEPQQAVVEENILLFAKDADRQPVASGVTARAMSPNHRQAAYVANSGNGLALWTAALNVNGQPNRLTSLPDQYAAPVTLTYSDDGARVAISTATETLVVPTGGGSNASVDFGGRVAFAPGQNDVLLGQAGSQLFSVPIAGGNRQVLENEVTAWATGQNQVAISTRGNLLVRRDLHTGSRKTFNLKAPLNELTSSPATDQMYGRDQSLSLFAVGQDSAAQIAGGVTQYAFGGGGNAVAYAIGSELYVRQRPDGPDRLVTRFSEPVGPLAVITDGYYIFYVQGGEEHVIAADGSNDQTLGAAGTPPLNPIDTTTQLLLDTAGNLTRVTILKR